MSDDEVPVTLEDWRLEVRRAVGGERDGDISILGGIGEYFDVQVANSDDAAVAAIHLHDAIEYWLQYWHPQPVSQDSETVHGLNLLHWFTPPGGIEKALQILAEWPSDRIDAVNPVPPPDIIDLHMRALEILEQYYAVPPSRVTPAYTTYLEILDAQLDLPEYRTHALARLFSLGALKPESEIASIFDEHPSALESLLELILRQPSKSRVEASLKNAYAQCFSRSLLVAFEDAIVRLGGSVTATPNSAIVTHGGRLFYLTLDREQLKRTWESAPAAMEGAIDSVLARAGEADDANSQTQFGMESSAN